MSDEAPTNLGAVASMEPWDRIYRKNIGKVSRRNTASVNHETLHAANARTGEKSYLTHGNIYHENMRNAKLLDNISDIDPITGKRKSIFKPKPKD